MTGKVLDWAFVIGLLLWLALCLSTIWLGGGAKHNQLGQLAAGLLQLSGGALFVHVAVINVYARMDNAYLSNGLLGAHLILAGLILLAASLVGYRVPLWLAGLLVVVYPVVGVFGIPLIAQLVSFPDSSTLLFAAIPLVATLLYVALRRRVLDVLIAVALAGLGLALVWSIYGAGLQAFVPVDTISEPIVKPPLLDFVPYVACLLTSAALFYLGRFVHHWWLDDMPNETIVSAP